MRVFFTSILSTFRMQTCWSIWGRNFGKKDKSSSYWGRKTDDDDGIWVLRHSTTCNEDLHYSQASFSLCSVICRSLLFRLSFSRREMPTMHIWHRQTVTDVAFKWQRLHDPQQGTPFLSIHVPTQSSPSPSI